MYLINTPCAFVQDTSGFSKQYLMPWSWHITQMLYSVQICLLRKPLKSTEITGSLDKLDLPWSIISVEVAIKRLTVAIEGCEPSVTILIMHSSYDCWYWACQRNIPTELHHQQKSGSFTYGTLSLWLYSDSDQQSETSEDAKIHQLNLSLSSFQHSTRCELKKLFCPAKL